MNAALEFLQKIFKEDKAVLTSVKIDNEEIPQSTKCRNGWHDMTKWKTDDEPVDIIEPTNDQKHLKSLGYVQRRTCKACKRMFVLRLVTEDVEVLP